MSSRLLIIPVTIACCGCGTLSNITPCTIPPHHFEPYGGVRNSWFIARHTGEFERDGKTRSDGALKGISDGAVSVYFTVVDVPLSAIGDTLTLPLVLNGHAHAKGIRKADSD